MTYSFDFFDTLPYFLLFSLVFVIIKSARKEQRLSYIMVVVLIFLGIRYGIGYDYFEYRDAILNNNAQRDRMEPLARALIAFAEHTHYQLFFVLMSVLTVMPICYVCKRRSIDPVLSFVAYLLIPVFFLDGMSTVRNSVAYSFVMLSWFLLNDGKYKVLSVVPFLIALGFHASSIIAVLMLLLFFVRVPRNIFFFIWLFTFIVPSQTIISLIVNHSGLPFLSGALWYLDADQEGGRFLWLLINVVCVINFTSWRKLVSLDPRNMDYLMLFATGACIYNLFIGIDKTLALRLSNFYCLFFILLIPHYKSVVRKYKMPSRVIYYALISLFAFYFYNVIVGSNGEKISFLPYQTIFHHIDYLNLQ